MSCFEQWRDEFEEKTPPSDRSQASILSAEPPVAQLESPIRDMSGSTITMALDTFREADRLHRKEPYCLAMLGNGVAQFTVNLIASAENYSAWERRSKRFPKNPRHNM
jgi:hypothetical protein